MRILFIHNRYKLRGGEDAALDLESELLLQKGHTIKTLIFENENIGGAVSKIKTGLNAIYSRSSSKLTQRVIEEFRPDVIHVHNLFFVASPSVLYIAEKCGIPVVMTIHNYRLVCANALLLRENKVCELCVEKTFPIAGIRYRCYRNSMAETLLTTGITTIHKLLGTWQKKIHTYIVLTEFAKKKLLHSSLKIEEKKLVIKPNFVHDVKFSITGRKNYFLFAGRISEEKGVRFFLEAMAALPQYEAIVVGDGPEKELLEKQYAEASNITFTGKKKNTEIRELMSAARALVFPSIWYEGLPFTIIEAFSTGTPVIASRLGAMESLIRNDYNGLHFEAGNAADLQNTLTRFDRQVSNGADYYRNARQSYLDHYQPESHYRSVLKIYQDAVESAKRKTACL